MRHNAIPLLNLAIGLSLAFSGILSGPLVPTPVARATSSAPVAAPGEISHDLAPRRVKRERKHDREQTDRKQDRKQKDRKSDREKDHKKDHRRDRELNDGRLAELGASPHGQLSIEDSYIVVLEDRSADALTVATDMATVGVMPTHVYEHVLNGFAAVIPDDQLETVRNDPQVRAVVPDREVHAYEQTLPTGADRIDVDLNPTSKINGSDERVDVDVAVLDTGIAAHTDLNIAGGVSCIPGNTTYADDNGHGTHVAGTVAALDNAVGVVGVAPGARLWSVKVLNSHGSGSWSSVICGLNWVAANSLTIDVANLSLGGGGSDSPCSPFDPLHNAICQVVFSGTPVVVAAGNSGGNANSFVPAAYDEVITVSALVDSDGRTGSLGPQTSRGPDGSLATFSNFGADVDIAAPGVGILSTVPGGYSTFSGTSMASPHVAGAAALYLATNPSTTPAQVKAALLSTREAIALPGDPDGINEGVLNVAGDAPPPPPTVDPVPATDGDTVDVAPATQDDTVAPKSNENNKKNKKKNHKKNKKKKH